MENHLHSETIEATGIAIGILKIAVLKIPCFFLNKKDQCNNQNDMWISNSGMQMNIKSQQHCRCQLEYYYPAQICSFGTNKLIAYSGEKERCSALPQAE